ncbi:MAG: hypothetical protein Kow0037_30600 [Calditrichia bacterium]
MVFRLGLLLLMMGIVGNLLAQSDSTRIQQLEKRIEALEQQLQQNELEKLKAEAEAAAKESNLRQEKRTFRDKSRALQALNPEISVASDASGQYIMEENGFNEEARSGAHFRVAELQFQSALDPFSSTKIILEFRPEEVEFAEAYLTWHRFLPNISLTAGKFRQQFGVVNRWHEHSLDQYDFPLALTTILGEEGLNQMGVSLDWLMPPVGRFAQYLTLQITNGQNDHLFSGEAFSFPAGLLHYKLFREINAGNFLEIGLSGMWGTNHFAGFEEGEKIVEPTRHTRLAGADLTYRWEPVNRSKYRSLLWRSEFFYAQKELPENAEIKAAGFYSYLEYRFARRWQAGVRYDYIQPFTENNSGEYLYQVVPYLTWWQSEWVRLRLQFNHLNGSWQSEANNTLRLQITWAIGPHKHERY